MNRNVFSVRTLMTIGELSEFLDKNKIHGAPVVDRNGKVLGVITLADVALAVKRGQEPVPEHSFYHASRENLLAKTFWPKKTDTSVFETPIEQDMSREVISASPDDTVGHLAKVMREKRIHRILIIEDGKLVGIVTAFDLLGCLDDDS